jgi:hypothetical protein
VGVVDRRKAVEVDHDGPGHLPPPCPPGEGAAQTLEERVSILEAGQEIVLREKGAALVEVMAFRRHPGESSEGLEVEALDLEHFVGAHPERVEGRPFLVEASEHSDDRPGRRASKLVNGIEELRVHQPQADEDDHGSKPPGRVEAEGEARSHGDGDRGRGELTGMTGVVEQAPDQPGEALVAGDEKEPGLRGA